MKTCRVLVNGKLIDGRGGKPLEQSAVVICGDRIQDTGESDSVEIPEGAEIIDIKGKTIMPGLIEGHAHVSGKPESIQLLRLSLQRGITTICSVSANVKGIELRDAVDNGYVRGCARLIAGCIVTPTFGHVRYRTADGPWEVRKAVREMVMEGADFIKTAASGGFAGRDEVCDMRNYTYEELEALVDEAHAWHVPVVAHCHTQPGLNNCIEAKVDQIHHGAFIDREAVQGIKEKELYYMPTLSVTCQRNIDAKEDRPWETTEMSESQPIHRAGVEFAHEIGVKLTVGTDYPGTARTWKIGDRTHWELKELIDCGLTPMEAIVAATYTNARAFGKQDELGTIEAGKRADMRVLTGNPLEDLAVLYNAENTCIVIKDGIIEYTDDEYHDYYQIGVNQPAEREHAGERYSVDMTS